MRKRFFIRSCPTPVQTNALSKAFNRIVISQTICQHAKSMPALERAPGVDLMEEIRHLKREKNAVILAHNYQVKEIQEVADFVGDSLGLSVQAASTTADVIAFCGVHFMAETAKILNPNKKVILPDLDAGCSLADSCPGEALDSYLNKHSEKNYYVIAYINCSAAVKALSDVIVTSGNAVRIVDSAPRDRNLLFVPDQNLGQYIDLINRGSVMLDALVDNPADIRPLFT